MGYLDTDMCDCGVGGWLYNVFDNGDESSSKAYFFVRV